MASDISKETNSDSRKQIRIIYLFLIISTWIVFGQAGGFDFIMFDDPVYVTENPHVLSGLTPENVLWAFSTMHAEFWHPLTWLSLMLDYQIYGLNAGAYHVTNLILHMLTALLLFRLLHRMTGAVWRSALVAALFALHPLHVETVLWITKRKDLLCAFFSMLTLCLYVDYTGKPAVKRYAFVLLTFACALMSKSMAVTLPAVMMLLDYWPLKRFALKKNNVLAWQAQEKALFFILSFAFSLITIYAQHDHTKHIPISLDSRLANAPVSLTTYLAKTLWPYDLAVFYPFSDQLPLWQVAGSIMLIIVISLAVIVAAKRLPYLFVGWLWYVIMILPVLDIFRPSIRAMSDNYTYLPTVGIYMMAAWGMAALFPQKRIRKRILWPAGAAIITLISILAWRQCGYWENSFKLFDHALRVTQNNYMAYNQKGFALYQSRQYPQAIENFNTAIRIKPDYVLAYNNRAMAYALTGQHQKAIEDYSRVIRLDPNNAWAYNNRGNAYAMIRRHQQAIKDYDQALRLDPDYALAYYNRGYTYAIYMGQYQHAIDDLNEAIRKAPEHSDSYLTRGAVYFKMNNAGMACLDYRQACKLGNCHLLKSAQYRGACSAIEPSSYLGM